MAKTNWDEVFSKDGYKNTTFRKIAEYLHETNSDRFEYYKEQAASGKHISTVRNEFYDEFFPDNKPKEKKKVSISAFEF